MLKNSGGKLLQGFRVFRSISNAVLPNSANMNLFVQLNDHQFNTDKHTLQLVKLISHCYSKIKLCHWGKQTTALDKGKNVRENMSKLILFKQQRNIKAHQCIVTTVGVQGLCFQH